MEGLAPPLACLIEIQVSIRNGETIRSGIQRYVQSAPAPNELALQMRQLLTSWDRGLSHQAILKQAKSHYRRALIEICVAGLAGQSVMPMLEELRVEIEDACEMEIRHHLDVMPIKMLVPLLIFQFPAYLLLLFGPLLKHLITELNK